MSHDLLKVLDSEYYQLPVRRKKIKVLLSLNVPHVNSKSFVEDDGKGFVIHRIVFVLTRVSKHSERNKTLVHLSTVFTSKQQTSRAIAASDEATIVRLPRTRLEWTSALLIGIIFSALRFLAAIHIKVDPCVDANIV